MSQQYNSTKRRRSQAPPNELTATFRTLNDEHLLQRLQAYRPVGRRGYPLRALWHAYVSAFILNLPSTNALIRRLQDDFALRHVCGFRGLPHRSTFNRFINRLAHHTDLVEESLVGLTNHLKALLPDQPPQGTVA